MIYLQLVAANATAGLKRIKDLCDEAGCKVEFRTEKDDFVVAFYRNLRESWGTKLSAMSPDVTQDVTEDKKSLDERILHFSSFLEFLQTLIDNKIYSKLFEFFGFDKALLLNNDRYITDINFMQCLKELNFSKDNDDIIPFITSLCIWKFLN